MKKLILIICLATTGCAQLGDMWFNRQDPCQSQGRANYQYPAWCGASGNYAVVTRSANSYRPVYTSQVERW